MSNNLNQSEKDLQQLIEGYEPEYSSEAWDRLNNSLPVKSYKWYYAAAGLLLGFFALVYMLDGPIEKDQANLAENIPALSQAETNNSEIITETIALEKSVESICDTQKDKLKIVKPDNTESIPDAKVVEHQEEKILFEEDNDVEILIPELDAELEEDSQIMELKKPEMYLSANTGCQPLEIEFKIKNLPEDASVSWDLGNGNLCQKSNFQYKYLKSGNFTVKLNVSTSTDHFSVEEEILVKPKPKADFSFSIEEGFLEFENLSQNYQQIEWDFYGILSEEENPSFEMLYSGTYPVSVKITNEFNCFDTYKEHVNYIVDHKVFAPNAFTPDGDGQNDEFVVKHEVRLGYVYTLHIFDAFGNLLFETQDTEKGWDGTVNRNVQNSNQEQYTWVLTITDPRGVSVNDKGTFKKLMR